MAGQRDMDAKSIVSVEIKYDDGSTVTWKGRAARLAAMILWEKDRQLYFGLESEVRRGDGTLFYDGRRGA